MKEIENKEEILKRVNELYRKPPYRLSCEFCGSDSHNYRINNHILEFDGQKFVQFFCKRCGYSILLDYNILMGIVKIKDHD